MSLYWWRTKTVERTLTGNCPVREHTGDGEYVGRCEFACYDGICPRHGLLSAYSSNDDREVAVNERVFVLEGESAGRKQ